MSVVWMLLLFFLVSCENNQWFRSEKTLKKLIQGVWKREYFTITEFEERWTFNDGKVTIVIDNFNTGKKDTNSGTYSINAKIFSSSLTTEGFTDTINPGFYNNKFTIVELDEKVLLLVANNQAGAIIQHEFSKKN